MQLVHHVVMTTDKGSIDPGGLQDCQFERSLKELPTNAVVDKDEVATRELHRKRASGEVVGAQFPGELDVEVADRLVLVLVARVPLTG
jgi:hypothetical protein